ncbi:CRISPR-associated protein, Cas2 family [Ectothiorhodospira mobilis]|uniref:CRISPR-associated endoribonuclease Cas2 n=1 Tax=Ectothiorhodospira mobilis TaxID=195064 RepID=A0A1I4RPG1_ECTMO|nr:CRISPR-associated endonuclease Cas2 [Ectothiorhodospira mobilis]SFM54088.1 CRISPR-associated protein, Cas2 family [Ectothiorhodospira mobilis]
MSVTAQKEWIICYDIRDPKRLTRVHRFLKGHGQPVQYSVFYYEGHTGQLGRLLQDLEELIDPRRDDVRAYPIPRPMEVHTLGRGSLPDDVELHSDKAPGLALFLQGQHKT